MEKINKGYFEGEVLICGCSNKDNVYYKRLNKEFSKNGIKVYPMPTTPSSELGFNTYEKYEDLPKIPKSAYVLSHKSISPEIVDHLIEMGIKKILFYGKACADTDLLKKCESKGVQTRMGCPLMLFASGPCWLHAAIAGVKQEKMK